MNPDARFEVSNPIAVSPPHWCARSVLAGIALLAAILPLPAWAQTSAVSSNVNVRVANSQFFSADGGGGAGLLANRGAASTWETFTLNDLNGGVLADGDKVTLQASNRQFVSAEGGGGGAVNANRALAGAWETFVFKRLGTSSGGVSFALQTANGQYLCAEGGGGREVVANRSGVGVWETFLLKTLATTGSTAPTTIKAWSSAGNMSNARSDHTATLLATGKVLVVGGGNSVGGLASAELYDPATNSWSPAAPMARGRRGHTATLLSSGKLLVVGGLGADLKPIASAELYDPTTNTWSAASELIARNQHTAVLLPSGKVWVVGGRSLFPNVVDTADNYSSQLYDPATNTWSAPTDIPRAVTSTLATLLPAGKVLVSGGVGQTASPELYDPGTNTWAAHSGGARRYWHTATLLPSGTVLLAGGFYNNATLASADLYDPTNNRWSPTGAMSKQRRQPTANLLSSGRVLVVGGATYDTVARTYVALADGELYDSELKLWLVASGAMATARFNHTATTLPSGLILVVGGTNSNGEIASAEIFDPNFQK